MVAFVGRSGCGKTTLLLKVVAELRSRGLRVAVVKHTSHSGVETDIAGTDTRRYWDARADQVLLVAPDRVVHSRRVAAEPPLSTVLAGVGDVDIVLLEGFERAPVDKIEVVRSACSPEPLRGLQRRLATVTDVPGVAPACPTFELDDAGPVSDFLVGLTNDE